MQHRQSREAFYGLEGRRVKAELNRGNGVICVKVRDGRES